jgi:hypothetical protein
MSRIGIAEVQAVAERVLSPEHLVVAAVGTLSRPRLSELRGLLNSWT